MYGGVWGGSVGREYGGRREESLGMALGMETLGMARGGWRARVGD